MYLASSNFSGLRMMAHDLREIDFFDKRPPVGCLKGSGIFATYKSIRKTEPFSYGEPQWNLNIFLLYSYMILYDMGWFPMLFWS